MRCAAAKKAFAEIDDEVDGGTRAVKEFAEYNAWGPFTIALLKPEAIRKRIVEDLKDDLMMKGIRVRDLTGWREKGPMKNSISLIMIRMMNVRALFPRSHQTLSIDNFSVTEDTYGAASSYLFISPKAKVNEVVSRR